MNFINNGFVRVAAVTAAILLMPLIAMGLTSEVSWSTFDFIIMGLICLAMGSLFVVVSRLVPHRKVFISFIFLVIFVYIWAELAVGIFTDFGS